jgi:hypothetical protein
MEIQMKHIDKSLSVIRQIEKGLVGKVVINDHSLPKGTKAKLFKSEKKGFNLELTHPEIFFSKKDTYEDFSIKVGRQIRLNVKRFFTTNRSPGYQFGKISSFCHPDFNETKEQFFRLALPLQDSIYFRFFFEVLNFQTSLRSFHNGLIQVIIGESPIDLFIYHDKTQNRRFLFLDSHQPISFDSFSFRTYVALIGLGFVTGKFIQNEGYYLGFMNSEMDEPTSWKFSELRDSLNAFYTPIYSNAHGVLWRDEDAANRFQPLLRSLKSSEFSNLCHKIYEFPDFQAIMLLILESCTSSLLMMPAGLSVALEGLADLFKDKVEKAGVPMTKSIAKVIRKEMIEILERHQHEITDEGLKILKNKVNDLNKPTNQARLLKPFELLGIKLNQADADCINNRNHFLHGRISLGYYGQREDEKANQEMWYNGLRLYTLISAFILKWAGYKGWIINHVKVQEHGMGRAIEEDYFREI